MLDLGVARRRRFGNSVAALVICLAGHAEAGEDPKASLLGMWGSKAQCDRSLLLPNGTVHAEPFEIHPGWLRHGNLWCRLSWFPEQSRPNGLFVSTQALCGEDSVRHYRLDFALADGRLTLIWDVSLISGPLMRCR